MQRWRSGVAALLAAAPGCAGDKLPLALVFPDEDARSATTGLVVTAVEPLAPAADSFSSRRVVKCGQIGVFPPTSKFNRDAVELRGVDNVLLNRVFHRYPLEESWGLDVDAFEPSEEANPWRAMMIHVEARGPAQRYDGGGIEPPDEATLLAGCFCVRFDDKAVHSDTALDTEVKKVCIARSELQGDEIEVALEAVAPPEFRVEPCGVSTLTAPRGQPLATSAAVCLRTIRCGENSGGQACFRCEQQTCSELDDLKNVPIRIGVQGGAGTQPKGSLLLTDRRGRVVPEIDVAECVAPFQIRASILGRPNAAAVFDVECVPAPSFEAGVSTPVGGMRSTVVGMSTVPGGAGVGGERQPALLALLIQSQANVRVEVYASQSGSFVLTATSGASMETARDVHGYLYRLDPAGAPRRGERPLLAVATSSVAVVGGMRMRTEERVILRIYEVDVARRRLILRRQTHSSCPVCTCERPSSVESCRACNCDPSFNLSTRISMTDADVDGDGFSDLAIGMNTGFALTTYYSAVVANGPPDRELYPGPLDASCTCSRFGKLLSTFELLRLGGNDSRTEGVNTDFVVGDVTGAFALYAQPGVIDGAPCDVTRDATAQCGPNNVCRPICAGSRGRCLEPCDPVSPRCSSPLRPVCTATIANPQRENYFCEGAILQCDQPNSIWKLINVRHVSRARLTTGGFDDVVAIGSRSPAPGADDPGVLRVIFGDRLDLTRIDNEPLATRLTSSFDLDPLSFEGRGPPQGPRGSEIGDFNNDGYDDIAVLYGASEEIHVWLGGGNRGPGEIADGIRLNDCGEGCTAAERCFPLEEFTAGDFDGDGFDEIAVVCDPTDAPRIVWSKPEVR